MKLPVAWLREYIETPLDDVALADRLTMAGLEVEETTAGEIGAIFHTKVTPNRGDWMSIVGSAREAAAALDIPFQWVSPVAGGDALRVNSAMQVRIEDPELCPRFTGRVIRNVQITDSPPWMQRKLIACGMRPLNVVVDITNYVMLELGQPLHAYDLDSLPGGQIIVRRAQNGEMLTTLDGVGRKLTPDMLLICDAEKPIGLAGIMGGGSTEVTAATKHIFLESAHFDPGVVRRASKTLALSTEASYRFERFVDPELAPLAAQRACDLLAELAGGEIAPDALDLYPQPYGPRVVPLRVSRVNRILGTNLTEPAVASSLRRLGLSVEPGHDSLRVTAPTFRPDLVQEIDLVEEVARMIGYETLPETLPPARDAMGGVDCTESRFASQVSAVMTGLGLQEALTNSLVAPSMFDDETAKFGQVQIRQALSAELSSLRTALVPNLLEALVRNLKRRQPDVRLFEVGKTFTLGDVSGSFCEARHVGAVLTGADTPRGWEAAEPKPCDFFTAKGIVEALAAALRLPSVAFAASKRLGMHPGRCADILCSGETVGYAAEVDPDWVTDELGAPTNAGRVAVLELNLESLQRLQIRSARYAEPLRFPSVSRDLAVVVDAGLAYGQIAGAIREAADSRLLHDLALASIYTGKGVPGGKKSVAVRLTFQAEDRTLTDAEIEAQVEAIREYLMQQLGAAQR